MYSSEEPFQIFSFFSVVRFTAVLNGLTVIIWSIYCVVMQFLEMHSSFKIHTYDQNQDASSSNPAILALSHAPNRNVR